MIERVNFTEEKEMSELIRKINWKYVVVMLIGNIILGLGIAIFKLSGLGNDPSAEWLWHWQNVWELNMPVF